ncbi:hypothetical protein J3R83DRAFT_10294, partial [Lanmaoa asiatica]
GSVLNHRRGFCMDGVKQTSKVKEVPPWLQPHGLFTEGWTFHPIALLDVLKRIIEHAVMDIPRALTTIEDKAFATLIKSRIFRTEGGRVLFHLFKEFAADPSTPDSYFHTQDGSQVPPAGLPRGRLT